MPKAREASETKPTKLYPLLQSFAFKASTKEASKLASPFRRCLLKWRNSLTVPPPSILCAKGKRGEQGKAPLNCTPFFNPLHSKHLLERRANSRPPFNTFRAEGLLGHPTRSSCRTVSDKSPFEFLSVPSPYSRKPGPFGPNVSICEKGVSTGVHNIAFLLWPDDFRCK